MSSNEAWLALYFDAPLLSFGGECKFDRRETLSFPSRSAVTGLVAAALGVARDDRRLSLVWRSCGWKALRSGKKWGCCSKTTTRRGEGTRGTPRIFRSVRAGKAILW